MALTGLELWLEYSGHDFESHFQTALTWSKFELQWKSWNRLANKLSFWSPVHWMNCKLPHCDTHHGGLHMAQSQKKWKVIFQNLPFVVTPTTRLSNHAMQHQHMGWQSRTLAAHPFIGIWIQLIGSGEILAASATIFCICIKIEGLGASFCVESVPDPTHTIDPKSEPQNTTVAPILLISYLHRQQVVLFACFGNSTSSWCMQKNTTWRCKI